MIHIFELIPGASRQNEPTVCQTKTSVQQIAVSRAGAMQDQYLVFIDRNRDVYCTSLKADSNFEIFKIGLCLITYMSIDIIDHLDNSFSTLGTQVQSVMWASESNILVGLHDACYSVWYCPGEASIDPTVIALTTVTFDIA